MLSGLIQHLRDMLKPESYREFMQNVSVYCPVEEVRTLGFEDEEIKKLRREHYNANAAKVGHAWWDDDDDGDDDDNKWEYESVDGHVKIFIEGPIDSWFGVDAPAIVRKLRNEDEIKSIHTDIASPGGYVTESLTLYHELKAQQRKGVPITTESRGVVASAATDLFVAGDTRVATQHSMFMVHAPWAFAFLIGNKWDMKRGYKKLMTSFDVFTQNAVDILADNIEGLEKKTVEGWFKQGDKWFNETQALEHGLATEVADQVASDDAGDGDGDDDDDDMKNKQDDDDSNKQHDEGGEGQREPPDEPPTPEPVEEPEPSTLTQEAHMKLSAEREAKIRSTLNLADDVEITEQHVDDYLEKEEADREHKDMQREMQDTARIRATVDEGLKPFYDEGKMSKVQLDNWAKTIMRSDQPLEQLKEVVTTLEQQFGAPGAQQQQQQQQRVDQDPGAEAAAAAAAAAAEEDDEEKETVTVEGVDLPVGKARKRFRELCKEGGNTDGAFKYAYRTVKEEFGMPTMRAMSTASQIDTKLEGESDIKAFRRRLRQTNTFRSMINADEDVQVKDPWSKNKSQ